MWDILFNGLLAAGNIFFNRGQNTTPDQRPISKWRTFCNFIFSTISTVGIPLIQSATGNDTAYEFVNAALGSSTTNRNNNIDHHERQNSGISRLSRPNFRRRRHHSSGAVRIIRPTINIHIHQT
ncbi:unnamed protein product [Adineta steineri]|uniref:Uncharacterized protein n=1 Tax=Adineta steineri TaxID=433720 RepID=A0A818REI1_9BILA|nr:unnamed protein product [Adineta steineri]CAF1055587.1 unnamed protein product [Adineta steineri]CAF3544547.1 unnamed protein product [Adineta steineri]CAF3656003.1 unnamed protein product [Adineta steineri]